jgi:hypothetical protein
MSRRRQPIDPHRARAALRWGLLTFLAGIVVQTAGFDANPELCDCEYGERLRTLRERRAEAPDRPQLLVLGSSRTVMAFAPEQLPPLPTPTGSNALPFNFGLVGAGPILNLAQVSRMLADGVRPDWVVLELMPTFVCHENMAFISVHAAARDLPVIGRHVRWHRLYGEYALRRLWVAPKYPGELLARFAPDMLPTGLPKAAAILPLGGCTYLQEDMSPSERERLSAISRKNLQDYLGRFQVSPAAEAATRETLDRLRSVGTRTLFLLTPEGPEIKSWYGPGARERFEKFISRLSREYDVPVVDARGWLGDDDTYDGHHALRRGAEKFTRRLGRDVLVPYLSAGDTSWAARFDTVPALVARRSEPE